MAAVLNEPVAQFQEQNHELDGKLASGKAALEACCEENTQLKVGMASMMAELGTCKEKMGQMQEQLDAYEHVRHQVSLGDGSILSYGLCLLALTVHCFRPTACTRPFHCSHQGRWRNRMAQWTREEDGVKSR